MTTRRPILELRAHADKVPGYAHLVAHEMVDEIEELRERIAGLEALQQATNYAIEDED